MISLILRFSRNFQQIICLHGESSSSHVLPFDSASALLVFFSFSLVNLIPGYLMSKPIPWTLLIGLENDFTLALIIHSSKTWLVSRESLQPTKYLESLFTRREAVYYLPHGNMELQAYLHQ